MSEIADKNDREIFPVTRQSVADAAAVLGRAFADEPVSVAIYRNFSLDRRARALTVDFSAELFACLDRAYPIHIKHDGHCAGAALIYPPGAYPLPQFEEWIILLKSIIGNGLYDFPRWIRWQDEAHKFHPTVPHYYLAYIGVDPSCQGKGFGSLIMQHLTGLADRDHMSCHLESANPRNLSLYQRSGFVIRDEKDIAGIHTWFLWRPPK